MGTLVIHSLLSPAVFRAWGSSLNRADLETLGIVIWEGGNGNPTSPGIYSAWFLCPDPSSPTSRAYNLCLQTHPMGMGQSRPDLFFFHTSLGEVCLLLHDSPLIWPCGVILSASWLRATWCGLSLSDVTGRHRARAKGGRQRVPPPPFIVLPWLTTVGVIWRDVKCACL